MVDVETIEGVGKVDPLIKLRGMFDQNTKEDDFFYELPKFYSDYERENPVTRNTGWERWRLFMKEKTPESYVLLNKEDKFRKITVLVIMPICRSITPKKQCERICCYFCCCFIVVISKFCFISSDQTKFLYIIRKTSPKK